MAKNKGSNKGAHRLLSRVALIAPALLAAATAAMNVIANPGFEDAVGSKPKGRKKKGSSTAPSA